jgi:hypothetical protein
MRERDQGRGGCAHGGGAGARGPGLGCTAGQNPVARTTTDRNPIRETKYKTGLSNTRDLARNQTKEV